MEEGQPCGQLACPRMVGVWSGSRRCCCRMDSLTARGTCLLDVSLRPALLTIVQWVVNESGSSTRLPPRGPLTPPTNAILLLVTENHLINVCYLPPYFASMKIYKVSLLQAGGPGEIQPRDETLPNAIGSNICTAAAIGMGYNGITTLYLM